MIEPGTVNVGDKLIVKGRGREFMRTVTKITPTGRIRIKDLDDFQFDPYGNEMGVTGFGRSYTLFPYDEDEARNIIRRNMRRNVINVGHHLSGEEDLRTLENLAANLQGWIDGIKEGRL